MKRLFFLLIPIFIFGCKPSSDNQKATEEENDSIKKTTYKDLPDGKWNGEYIKVKDDSEPQITKKSLGAEFYVLGSAFVLLETDTIDIKTFVARKNVLSYNNRSINAFVKGAANKGQDIRIYAKRPNMEKNHNGKYTIDPIGTSNNGIKVEIVTEEDTFTLSKGEATIKQVDFYSGAFEMTFTGDFNTEKGKTVHGKGTIDMKFDNTIRVAD